MHDMGNSMGGLGSYMKLIDKYDMYQGGFIWDFIDQAILVKDPVTGKEVLRYGGDFDDKPSDYEFSANGIVFADRQRQRKQVPYQKRKLASADMFIDCKETQVIMDGEVQKPYAPDKYG